MLSSFITGIFNCLSPDSFGATNTSVYTSAYSSVPFKHKHSDADAIGNLIIGFIHYNNSDYARAIKYLKKETKNTGNAYLYYIMSKLYFKNMEYNKSLSLINTALKLTKVSSERYLILKAKILAGKNNINASVKIVKTILKKDPTDLKALLFLSKLYIFKRDFNTAILYLNIAKIDHPLNIDTYYMLSKLYITENKMQQAKQTLTELIRIAPYFKKGYFRLSGIYIASGHKKYAIRILHQYLTINPHSKMALYQLAVLYYATKKYVIARKYLFDFLDIARKDKNMSGIRQNALLLAGLSYTLQKEYLKGLVYFNMPLTGEYLVHARLEAIKIYLLLYKKTGNKKYAAKIKTAINTLLSNPDFKKNVEIYYYPAIALSELNDFNGAKTVLLKGIEYFPDDTLLLYELGSVYHSLKDDKKANLIMQKILKTDPSNADALNFTGYCLALKSKDAKDLKKAKMLIEKALRINKNAPYILDSLGFVYYQSKQYVKAMKYFKLAVKKLAGSSTVLKHIGMDYFMLKNYRQAIKYLKKSYRIKPTQRVKYYIKRAQIMLHL